MASIPTVSGGEPYGSDEMEFFKDFFTGKSSSASTASAGLLSPEQEAALKMLLATLDPSNPANAQPYGGQLTADPNQLQASSLAAMEAAAMNAVAPGGSSDVSSNALMDIMKMGQPDLTDYFKSTIDNPTMQVFNQEILPAITRRFAGQAGFGSDRMSEEALAAGNTATGIAKARGDASQVALRDLMQAKIGAAGALSGIGLADVQRLLELQRGGGIAQEAAQRPLTAAYEEFQRQQKAKDQNIQDILAALGIRTKENITTVLPGSGGFLQGAAGGAGSAAVTALLA